MGNTNSADKMMDQVFELKFLAKQMNRSAERAAKESRAEKVKVYKAMTKGNMEGAKIYAENSIRKHQESLSYMAQASQLESVVDKLKTQANMQSITQNFSGITKTLATALQENNLEKTTNVMNKFQKQCTEMGMQMQVQNEVMGKQAAGSTPVDQVDALMAQVADEYNLNLQTGMANAPMGLAQGQANYAGQQAVPLRR